MRNCLPVSLALKKPKRSLSPLANYAHGNVLITLQQEYEDNIENMKVQFAAISEEKAEVERKLKPLIAEFDDLRKQADELETRKLQHTVSSSSGLLCC